MLARRKESIELVLRVLRESWPLIVAEGVGSLVWLIDTFFVSLLGDTAVAATGAGGYGAWLFSVFFTLFYVAALVLVSQSIGARQYVKASRISGEIITLSLLTSILLLLFAFIVAYDLMYFLSSSENVSIIATDYFIARALGFPFAFILFVLDAIYRASEKNREILVSAVIVSVTNTVLDPVLIFILGYGVTGAGLATTISYIPGLIYLAYNTRHRLGFPLRLSIPRENARLILKVGFPAMAERLLFSTGHSLYLAIVARCGEVALAAHTIGVRIEALAFLPAFALSTYSASIVGQRIGAQLLEKAEEEGWEITKASSFLMGIIGLLLAVSSPLIPLVFGVSREVASLAATYILLAALSEPLLGIVMVLGGAIRGAGNTKIPSILNVAGFYAFRVMPSFTLLIISLEGSLCPILLWIIMDIDLLLRSLLFIYVYKKYFKKIAKVLV